MDKVAMKKYNKPAISSEDSLYKYIPIGHSIAVDPINKSVWVRDTIYCRIYKGKTVSLSELVRP